MDDQTGNKHNSKYLNVNIGVPQGSVLGPILFLLSVNPLLTNISESRVVAFADDTSAVVKIGKYASMDVAANKAIKEMNDWFGNNNLFLNISKTHFMVFYTSQTRADLDLDLWCQNARLNREKSVKFLGLVLDDTLSWEDHCLDLAGRLNSLCFAIRNLRAVLEPQQLLTVYHAMVHSRILYAVQFWGTSSFADIVFKSQKRVVRCMAGVSSRTSCVPIFKKFKILTVPCAVIYQICLFVFNNKERFLKNNEYHSYNTRYQDNFLIPKNRLSRSKNFVLNIGPNMFNNLPLQIKTCDNLLSFKRLLKEFLVEECYYSIDTFLQC